MAAKRARWRSRWRRRRMSSGCSTGSPSSSRRAADASAALFATLHSARTLANSTNALCVSAGRTTRFPTYRNLEFPTSPALTPSSSTLSSHLRHISIFDNVFDLIFSTASILLEVRNTTMSEMTLIMMKRHGEKASWLNEG